MNKSHRVEVYEHLGPSGLKVQPSYVRHSMSIGEEGGRGEECRWEDGYGGKNHHAHYLAAKRESVIICCLRKGDRHYLIKMQASLFSCL